MARVPSTWYHIIVEARANRTISKLKLDLLIRSIPDVALDGLSHSIAGSVALVYPCGSVGTRNRSLMREVYV